MTCSLTDLHDFATCADARLLACCHSQAVTSFTEHVTVANGYAEVLQVVTLPHALCSSRQVDCVPFLLNTAAAITTIATTTITTTTITAAPPPPLPPPLLPPQPPSPPPPLPMHSHSCSRTAFCSASKGGVWICGRGEPKCGWHGVPAQQHSIRGRGSL
jgi:hypothetical protein